MPSQIPHVSHSCIAPFLPPCHPHLLAYAWIPWTSPVLLNESYPVSFISLKLIVPQIPPIFQPFGSPSQPISDLWSTSVFSFVIPHPCPSDPVSSLYLRTVPLAICPRFFISSLALPWHTHSSSKAEPCLGAPLSSYHVACGEGEGRRVGRRRERRQVLRVCPVSVEARELWV